MKVIKYKIMTETEKPDSSVSFQNVQITCSPENLSANEKIAKAEAYKGEYTVEDVGETYV